MLSSENNSNLLLDCLDLEHCINSALTMRLKTWRMISLLCWSRWQSIYWIIRRRLLSGFWHFLTNYEKGTCYVTFSFPNELLCYLGKYHARYAFWTFEKGSIWVVPIANTWILKVTLFNEKRHKIKKKDYPVQMDLAMKCWTSWTLCWNINKKCNEIIHQLLIR